MTPLPPPYLTHDLDVSDPEWGARAGLGLVAEHGQHKITRLAETLTHKECPGFTLGLQQCLCLSSRHVAMVPPREGSTKEGGQGKAEQSAQSTGRDSAPTTLCVPRTCARCL